MDKTHLGFTMAKNNASSFVSGSLVDSVAHKSFNIKDLFQVIFSFLT
jgi:hypothetical protein